MPRQEYVLSGYRGMWLFAMFDLPVTTAKGAEAVRRISASCFSSRASRCYNTRFTPATAPARRWRLRTATASGRLPPEGYVRLLAVTDRQFGKMESYIGENGAIP